MVFNVLDEDSVGDSVGDSVFNNVLEVISSKFNYYKENCRN